MVIGIVCEADSVCPRLAVLGAYSVDEGARPVAPHRPLPEHVQPPGDEARRARSRRCSSPWLRPNVCGLMATAPRPSTTTATTQPITGRARQRSAASTARPTSSAARLERESVSTSPAHSTASDADDPELLAALAGRAAAGRRATTITIARKRPKMSGSKNTELTVK